MAKKLNSVLGIDLGSQTIKIAEVKLQGRTPVITALGIGPTPDGAVDHIGVHDPQAIAAAIKAICAGCGATVSDVVVSLAGQGSVLVKNLEVPTMNDSELKSHMEWEITRSIPFSESTVVSDFKAFPPDPPGSQNMDVVMAVAPQSVVTMMVDMLKQSGKKPAALDVEPLSIARSLSVSSESELAGKTVCVVDIGHRTTAINMYRDGKLLMPRQVPIGGEMFTRSMADNLGVTFAEAEQIKETRATIPASVLSGPAQAAYNPFGAAQTETFAAYNPFADAPSGVDDPGLAPADAPAVPEPVAAAPADDPEAMRIYNAMAPVLDEFISEVRRSVDYFRSKGGDVDQILLAGGGSKLGGLSEFITSAIGLPCSVHDPLKGVTLSMKKSDTGMVESHKPDFSIAVGNGLHILF